MATLSLSAFSKGLIPISSRHSLTSIAAPLRRNNISLASFGDHSCVTEWTITARNTEIAFMQKRCRLNHRACSSFINFATSEVSGSQVRLEEDEEVCELVNGAELVLGEGTDSFRAYLLRAVKNNNGMGVLLLTDIYGFEDSCTRDFAYRVSCGGYNVLVPDLFRGDPWIKDRPRAELDTWISKQPRERVAKDIARSTKWMLDEFAAAGISEKIGIVGFCFGGGRLIETLASDHDAYFGTGVCFYGTRLNADLADAIKVPVMFVSGEKDPLCPVGILRELEKRIKGSTVVIYPDRGHGFAHRPESPEEDEDAEDAFTLMRNWLHESLFVKN